MFSYQSSGRCLATAILDYHICSSMSSVFSSFFHFSDPASRSLYPGSARARHLHLMFCSDTYQRNVLYHIICAYKCQLLFSTFLSFFFMHFYILSPYSESFFLSQPQAQMTQFLKTVRQMLLLPDTVQIESHTSHFQEAENRWIPSEQGQ